MLRIQRIEWPCSQLFYEVPQIKQQLFSILTIVSENYQLREEFCAATFRFCIIYDSRWKGNKVTLQQFISRYLCRASPSQLRRKNQKQVLNTDLVISSLKAATVKNPSRQNLFHEIGTPPQPVITRWGTWLDAAVKYFAENMPQIREIIAKFPEDGQIVTKVKHAALSPELVLELTEICRCYKSLLNWIGRIEGTSNGIMQLYRDLHALQFHEDPCSISEYISNRLLGKDFLDIINCTRENITPAMFSQIQQCCATSCTVERSFSLLKKLLSKERNFLPDNLKKYFIFYYNHAAKEIQWFVPYTVFQIKSYIKSYFDKR